MADRRIFGGIRYRGLASLSPHLALAILVLLAAAPIVLVAALVPHAMLLPTFSIGAIAIAAVTATVAWWRKAERHTPTVTLWDTAGAFMLIGCAAAMMTEPENLLQLFGHTQKN